MIYALLLNISVNQIMSSVQLLDIVKVSWFVRLYEIKTYIYIYFWLYDYTCQFIQSFIEEKPGMCIQLTDM